jgi:hypothetical protein
MLNYTIPKFKCERCEQVRKDLDIHQICRKCYKIITLFRSGNDVIDEFIRDTCVEDVTNMEFVPHYRFKDVKFIAEGGFSKIYKATWDDGPIEYLNDDFYQRNYIRRGTTTVVLKELSGSENIKSKELNEVLYIYLYSRAVLI